MQVKINHSDALGEHMQEGAAGAWPKLPFKFF